MIPIVIITSNFLRHKFFVNSLSKEFDVLGVVTEEKSPLLTSEQEEENEIIKKHFDSIKMAEEKYFGSEKDFLVNSENILRVERGGSNDDNVFAWIKDKNPDFIILYGSGIIKNPILSFFENRIINMHLGLSPYYRGSGTNFWPLYDDKPECVGATIHLAVLDVDAGAILAQTRPTNITIEDKHFDIGCKTIISGTKKMIECIKLYKDNKIIPTKQVGEGLLFKKSDFNANTVIQMLNNFENGMVANYLKDKEKRNLKYPIIEN